MKVAEIEGKFDLRGGSVETPTDATSWSTDASSAVETMYTAYSQQADKIRDRRVHGTAEIFTRIFIVATV